MEIVNIANTQLMIKNMSVEQVHLRAFLLVEWSSVNISNLMIKIEKIIIIIIIKQCQGEVAMQ